MTMTTNHDNNHHRSSLSVLPELIRTDILDSIDLFLLQDNNVEDTVGNDTNNSPVLSSSSPSSLSSSSSKTNRGSCEIESIQECKSAQQRVFVVTLLVKRFHEANAGTTETAAATTTTTGLSTTNKKDDTTVVVLVVRIWKGGSCWWNLHQNNLLQRNLLADSEIMGYTIARRAFLQASESTNNISNNKLVIPRVYKYVRQIQTSRIRKEVGDNYDDNEGNDRISEELYDSPYAFLEYVGPGSSTLFQSNDTIDGSSQHGHSGRTMTRLHDHQLHNSSRSISSISNNNVISTHFLERMVTQRHEFGFDEPHPRWGRVPVQEALDYARIVLRDVIIPLHRYCYTLPLSSSPSSPSSGRRNGGVSVRDAPATNDQTVWPEHQRYGNVKHNPYVPQDIRTYASMVDQYQRACDDMMNTIETLDTSGDDLNVTTTGSDIQKDCLQKLETAIQILRNNIDSITPMVGPCLVHLDLQPQNLQFGVFSADCDGIDDGEQEDMELGKDCGCNDTECECNEHHDDSIDNKRVMRVISVFDWEDAAWADPRFELLLLCRKVCANTEQADAVWGEYDKWYRRHIQSDDNEKQLDGLGPIIPWFQLETVHSICILLLQSMNLLHGGRNPWETKSDLWGKLEREFARWDVWLTT